MAAAEASAPHVTTAATATASATAARFRSGRKQAAGKQGCYQYRHQSSHHDTSFFSERSVRHVAVETGETCSKRTFQWTEDGESTRRLH